MLLLGDGYRGPLDDYREDVETPTHDRLIESFMDTREAADVGASRFGRLDVLGLMYAVVLAGQLMAALDSISI